MRGSVWIPALFVWLCLVCYHSRSFALSWVCVRVSLLINKNQSFHANFDWNLICLRHRADSRLRFFFIIYPKKSHGTWNCMTQIIRKTDVFSLKSRLNCCRVCSNLLNQYETKQNKQLLNDYIALFSLRLRLHLRILPLACSMQLFFWMEKNLSHSLFCKNREKKSEKSRHTRKSKWNF